MDYRYRSRIKGNTANRLFEEILGATFLGARILLRHSWADEGRND